MSGNVHSALPSPGFFWVRPRPAREVIDAWRRWTWTTFIASTPLQLHFLAARAGEPVVYEIAEPTVVIRQVTSEALRS